VVGPVVTLVVVRCAGDLADLIGMGGMALAASLSAAMTIALAGTVSTVSSGAVFA